MSNSEEARENGSRSEEVFIILFNISHINIVLLWLFRRLMSILRTVRLPAPRRFLPSMLKALDNALMFRCWGGGGEMRSWPSSPDFTSCRQTCRRFLSYLCSSCPLPWSGDWVDWGRLEATLPVADGLVGVVGGCRFSSAVNNTDGECCRRGRGRGRGRGGCRSSYACSEHWGV